MPSRARTKDAPAIFAAAAIAAVLSGGCILFRPHVGDLKFVALEPHDSRSAHAEPGRFRLRFTTKRNLLDLGGAGIYFDVGFCPSAYSFIASSGVYFHGQPLWQVAPVSFEQADDNPFVYEAFIDDERRQIELGAAPEDGRQSRSVVDLCFEISSPSYFDIGGFDSNVGVIPKEAVAAAIAREAKRH